MTSTQKKIGDSQIELSVELGREELLDYVRAAEDVYAREVKIDGFRPGKAPREKVREVVGEATILEAALQTAVQRSLAQAISENKFDVIEASEVSVKENSPEKLVYTVKIQLFPEIKIPALTGIKIQRRQPEVSNEEVDQALDTIRASRAILTDTLEPAQKGDRIEVDFKVKESGKLIEGGESKNHPVVIGNQKFVPGFEDELIGLKKGEYKNFSLTAPKDFANKAVAGKKLDFEVTVNDVKKVSLPEANDAFAKSLGRFENMDQLLINLKDGLMEEKKEKEDQRLRLEIMDALIKDSSCNVPEAMVTDQLTSMVNNFDKDLHQHEMELALYLAQIGKTQEDLKKEWRPEAERQVKMALILRKVAKDNNILVLPEELNDSLESLVQSAMLRGENSPEIDLNRTRSSLEARMLNEKTFEFLEKTCIVA